MNAVLLIAWKDLRQRLRDRSFFIYGVAAPLALASAVVRRLRRAAAFKALRNSWSGIS